MHLDRPINPQSERVLREFCESLAAREFETQLYKETGGVIAGTGTTTIDLATYINASVSDVSLTATKVNLGSATSAGLVARYLNNSNYYLGEVIKLSSTSYAARIYKEVNGTLMQLASTTLTSNFDPTNFSLQFAVVGNSLTL